MEEKIRLDLPLNEQMDHIRKMIIALARFVDRLDMGMDFVTFLRYSGLYDLLVDCMEEEKFSHLERDSPLKDFVKVGADFYLLNYPLNILCRFYHEADGPDDALAYFTAQRLFNRFGDSPALRPRPDMTKKEQELFLSSEIMGQVIHRTDKPPVDDQVMDVLIAEINAMAGRDGELTDAAAERISHRLRQFNNRHTRKELTEASVDPRREFCHFIRRMVPGLTRNQQISLEADLSTDTIRNLSNMVYAIESGLYPENESVPSPPKKNTLLKLYLTALPSPPVHEELFSMARKLCRPGNDQYLFYRDAGCRDFYLLQLCENLPTVRGLMGLHETTGKNTNLEVANAYLHSKGFKDLNGNEPGAKRRK